ncbi:virulence factor MviN, partial [Micromonospora sp. I033]
GGATTARGLAGLADGTPTTAEALAQGMLSGVVVGALFLAVAGLTDARDLRPLLGAVTRRLGRRRPPGAGDGPRADQHPGERGDGKETVSS